MRIYDKELLKGPVDRSYNKHELCDDDNVTELQHIMARHALNGYTIADVPEYGPMANTQSDLEDRIVGQPGAIAAIIKALERTQLRDPKRPIANLLFLGPTGVGKTETAKELADLMQDPSDLASLSYIKIDCASYSHGHEVAMLTGAPAGYIGHGETKPILNQELIEQPNSVVLFDEIEKGSPELWSLMLSIMNDGELTMGDTGKKLSFNNAIIIMTSNVGAREIKSLASRHQTGFTNDKHQATSTDMRSAAMKALEENFSPEFIGRITEKVMFNQLDDEQLGQVVFNHVEQANMSRYENAGVDLKLTSEVVQYLVESAEERDKFGARPVLNAYESIIETGLSERLGRGSIPVDSDVTCFLQPADDRNPEPTIHFAYKPKEDYMTDEEMEKARENHEMREAAIKALHKHDDKNSVRERKQLMRRIYEAAQLTAYEAERINSGDYDQV